MCAEAAEERLLRKRTVAEQSNLMRAMRRAASHSGGQRYQADGEAAAAAPPAEVEVAGTVICREFECCSHACILNCYVTGRAGERERLCHLHLRQARGYLSAMWAHVLVVWYCNTVALLQLMGVRLACRAAPSFNKTAPTAPSVASP